MPFGITRYVDPGVYINRRTQPGSVTVTTDKALCLVAIAPRTRRSTDEAIVRGKVYGESVSFSTSSPYKATLLNISNRDRNNAKLYRNGQSLGISDWDFVSAFLVGVELAGASVDVSVNKYFTVSVDGKFPITIDLAAEITTLGGDPANATASDIADAINAALVASSIYGSNYSSFASSSAGVVNEILRLDSPVSSTLSDIKVLLSISTDAASIISNGAWAPTASLAVQSSSQVFLKDSAYSSSAAYTIDYVSVDLLVDTLEQAGTSTPLSDIIFAGSYPGVHSYNKNYDYEKLSNNIDWDTTSWSQASILSVDGPFTATGTDLRISINGLTPITITLTSGLPNPTAANVAADINAALKASVVYGPAFAHVATVVGSKVKLMAPSMLVNFPQEKGYSSVIELYQGTTSGVTDIFGIVSTSLPYSVRGTGLRPDFGTVFYVTYNYTRPSSDYENPVRVFDLSDLYDFTSPITDENYVVNKLAIAGEVAFENGVSSIWLTLINDSTSPGSPTPTQVNNAIDICENKSNITDVVVIDTREAQAVHLRDHISAMSSLFEKKYRRGWFGMQRGSEVGDPDTPDTFVYWATRVLQPGNTSPGRGRINLIAPGSASRVVTLEDGREIILELDGSYLAAGVAAQFAALPGASDTLMGKFVSGFLTDGTFETYLQGERHVLASSGVNVITLDAGTLKMLDPITTEAGGGRLIEYEEPQASSQTDVVTRTIENILDQNVKGIVPTDLADFISDLKVWISLAIEANIANGSIGPYRSRDGSIRKIDLLTDIQVKQDQSDPRTFTFKYWFNLKYPAKRFFGEYSVDNPFFIG
jgi:hypothetical protein